MCCSCCARDGKTSPHAWQGKLTICISGGQGIGCDTAGNRAAFSLSNLWDGLASVTAGLLALVDKSIGSLSQTSWSRAATYRVNIYTREYVELFRYRSMSYVSLYLWYSPPTPDQTLCLTHQAQSLHGWNEIQHEGLMWHITKTDKATCINFRM